MLLILSSFDCDWAACHNMINGGLAEAVAAAGGERGRFHACSHITSTAWSEHAAVWHSATAQRLGTPDVENSGCQSNTNALGNISFCFKSLQFFTSLEQICKCLKEKKPQELRFYWNVEPLLKIFAFQYKPEKFPELGIRSNSMKTIR